MFNRQVGRVYIEESQVFFFYLDDMYVVKTKETFSWTLEIIADEVSHGYAFLLTLIKNAEPCTH